MVKYKLYYFNARGRAELIRFIFAVAGQEYEDIRLDFSKWLEYKPMAPLGQVPFIEIEEESRTIKMGQSITIARYLAKRFGLAGKNELEKAYADMYVDQVRDLLEEFVKCHFEKDDARKKEMCERLHTETLVINLKLFETRLATNNGWLAGDSLTYADLSLFGLLEWICSKKENIISKYPNIKKFQEKIASMDRIKHHIQTRPKTPM